MRDPTAIDQPSQCKMAHLLCAAALPVRPEPSGMLSLLVFLSPFHDFIFASLPLSHVVTPPNATHGPPATSTTGHQLSFFLSFSSLFSLSFFLFLLSSPSLVLRFSLSFFLSLIFLILYSYTGTAICFKFYSFTLLLISLFQ